MFACGVFRLSKYICSGVLVYQWLILNASPSVYHLTHSYIIPDGYYCCCPTNSDHPQSPHTGMYSAPIPLYTLPASAHSTQPLYCRDP